MPASPVAVKISKSDREGKKKKAVFTLRDGKTKTVHFGAAGMSDYTKHKDDDRKQRYIARHSKNENHNSPMTAGALSRYVLWNKKSEKESISDFKKRFNLK